MIMIDTGRNKLTVSGWRTQTTKGPRNKIRIKRNLESSFTKYTKKQRTKSEVPREKRVSGLHHCKDIANVFREIEYKEKIGEGLAMMSKAWIFKKKMKNRTRRNENYNN